MKRASSREPLSSRNIISILLGIPFVLSIFGALFIFEASALRGMQSTGDSFYFLKLQVQWIILGIITVIFVSRVSFLAWERFSFPILIMGIILLVAVLIPGIGHQVGGARRWIDLGLLTVQPTEIIKFALIIYWSAWFSRKKATIKGFIILLGGILGLILLQPDMGTTIMIFLLSCVMYMLSGASLKPLLLLIPLAAITLGALIVSAPYRLRRLTAFLRPDEDPLGVGFHINQILISLSEGGIFGRGFGASRQKYLFLPEAHTDSIFAIIGEELGFVGSVLLIGLYLALFYAIYSLYRIVPHAFAKMLVGGIFTYFGLQVLINLGGMANLMPLTGVTLPFVSYGGSSLLVSCICLGILVQITRVYGGGLGTIVKREKKRV